MYEETTNPFAIQWISIVFCTHQILCIQPDDGDAQDELYEADRAFDQGGKDGAGAVTLPGGVEGELREEHLL